MWMELLETLGLEIPLVGAGHEKVGKLGGISGRRRGLGDASQAIPLALAAIVSPLENTKAIFVPFKQPSAAVCD